LFFADVLGTYDVYCGSPGVALCGAVQVPLLDPLMLVPAMAALTRHLGLGVNANLRADYAAHVDAEAALWPRLLLARHRLVALRHG
jgi:alkanesulfonate monooxygenase SsuD/methylene tetrahydromethanopterin reductase-like flavin-dependent oxidoreductase (luciferase family)